MLVFYYIEILIFSQYGRRCHPQRCSVVSFLSMSDYYSYFALSSRQAEILIKMATANQTILGKSKTFYFILYAWTCIYVYGLLWTIRWFTFYSFLYLHNVIEKRSTEMAKAASENDGHNTKPTRAEEKINVFERIRIRNPISDKLLFGY